eukprot:IDg3768t1
MCEQFLEELLVHQIASNDSAPLPLLQSLASMMFCCPDGGIAVYGGRNVGISQPASSLQRINRCSCKMAKAIEKRSRSDRKAMEKQGETRTKPPQSNATCIQWPYVYEPHEVVHELLSDDVQPCSAITTRACKHRSVWPYVCSQSRATTLRGTTEWLKSALHSRVQRCDVRAIRAHRSHLRRLRGGKHTNGGVPVHVCAMHTCTETALSHRSHSSTGTVRCGGRECNASLLACRPRALSFWQCRNGACARNVHAGKQ